MNRHIFHLPYNSSLGIRNIPFSPFQPPLSLYSTATQNHSRWVRRSCVTYTNMLVYKNVKICFTPDAKPKICITPDAKPKRKSVEYRLRWVPNA